MGVARVGTCSWTEKTMVGLWYPPDVTSAEARLRYYAEYFDTVEVDSTFYALPVEQWSRNWAKRTPEYFLFHVKAFGLMTQHSVDPKVLTPELAEMEYGLTSNGRVKNPSPEMLDTVFDTFLAGIEPLKEAGKLGAILMQFPPYFTASTPEKKRASLDYLEYMRDRLAGYRIFVEFRDPSWVTGETKDEVFAFLADRDLAYVSVDSPQYPDGSTMPPIAAATTDWACVRFHGRNTDTWFASTKTAAERFDYLYNDDELRGWETVIRALVDESEEVFVLFNNNKHDFAQRNAIRMNELLGDVLLPVSHDGPPEQESLF